MEFGGNSKKKIRIVSTPTMEYGGQQPGQGYALDRTPDYGPFGQNLSAANPYGKVGRTLPEATGPGDINAEKQEQILGDFDQDGTPELMNVNGPSHLQGGKDVDVPSNSFVYSDTKDLRIKDPAALAQFGLKPNKSGYTPAEIAKRYDLNKYKQITSDPNTDDAAKKTAQLMSDNYLAKLNKLAAIQEGMKKQMGMDHHDPNTQPSMMARNGGMFQIGGEVYPPTVPPAHGSNWMPFDQDVASAQGYTGAPNTSDYQNWANMRGANLKVDGKMGAVTTAWKNPDQPIAPVPVEPLSPNGIWQPSDSFIGPPLPDDYSQGSLPATIPAIGTSPSAPVDITKKSGLGARFQPDPNFAGNALNVAQIASLRKFVPYEQVPQATIPETVFLDPTAALASSQEAARTATDAAMSGDARAGRATALAIQGQAGAQARDIIGDYGNKNVQIANHANEQSAMITNDLYKQQAARLSELNKGNFLSDRDYKRELGRLQSEYVDRQQKQHDNEVKTAWLNKTSPYFDIGPSGFPEFKSDNAKAKYDQMYSGAPSAESQRNVQDIYNKLEQQFPNVSKDKLFSQALGMSGMKEHISENMTPYGMNKGQRESGIYSGPQLEMGGKANKLKKFIKK